MNIHKQIERAIHRGTSTSYEAEYLIRQMRPWLSEASPEFAGLLGFLEGWRNMDHADNIQLSRHQVIVLLDGIIDMAGGLPKAASLKPQ